MADLHSSLRLRRADFRQDTFSVRLCASAQCCFTSAVHVFAAAAVVANSVWHGSDRSFMWSFTQAAIRPCPGFTSAQSVLMSDRHAFAARWAWAFDPNN